MREGVNPQTQFRVMDTSVFKMQITLNKETKILVRRLPDRRAITKSFSSLLLGFHSLKSLFFELFLHL